MGKYTWRPSVLAIYLKTVLIHQIGAANTVNRNSIWSSTLSRSMTLRAMAIFLTMAVSDVVTRASACFFEWQLQAFFRLLTRAMSYFAPMFLKQSCPEYVFVYQIHAEYPGPPSMTPVLAHTPQPAKEPLFRILELLRAPQGLLFRYLQISRVCYRPTPWFRAATALGHVGDLKRPSWSPVCMYVCM